MGIPTTERKKLGAYYTDEVVARFLAEWAITSPGDKVLEPCFGGGVFLRAATERLTSLGGSGTSVVGTDLDGPAWKLGCEQFPDLKLHNADFFTLHPNEAGLFDAVIGNPPFVRFHHFTGDARKRALKRAAHLGVSIPALASAWAPFLVHAASHLRLGGRLAMVVPFEITYAVYARPVVDFLSRSFAGIHCLMFDTPLFPDLSEKTCLLLCDRFGGRTRTISLHRYDSAAALNLPLRGESQRVPADLWAAGTLRTRAFDLVPECRVLYERLIELPKVKRLGQVTTLTIGYVTGDNDYFHLKPEDAKALGLTEPDLRTAIRRSGDLGKVGLEFSAEDAARLAAQGEHLLFLPLEPLNEAARAYIKSGMERKVNERFKCKSRKPWYRVPGVKAPELILNVLTAGGPRLVVNSAGVAATNSVLVVDSLPDLDIPPLTLAASAWTTLAKLSAEIEGHILGGGALKFEPSEARQWALPCAVPITPDDAACLDRLVRCGKVDEASNLADDLFLREGLGLDSAEIDLLKRGLSQLRGSRKAK